MSRRHGKFWLEGETVWYEDLGSSNGSWLGGMQLTDKVRLEGNGTIVLGETEITLNLVEESTTAQDGMTLQLRHRVRRGDLAGALKEAADRPDVLSTLATFVDKLLGAASLAELAPCLCSLYDHLATARHIFLVAPPKDDEEIRHLIDPKELVRQAGDPPGLVSRSLAKMAIEQGEALFFCQTNLPRMEVRETTGLRGIHSAAYIPMIGSDGSNLGVLCVDSPQSALPLHEANLQLLKSAGALLAARLDGERLRQEALERERETRELECRRETLANFLKIASHDLKNPLTVVKMCGFLIRKLADDEKVSDLCARLLDAERRAEQLITSYLEISEIESTQTLSVDLVELNLAELVETELSFLKKAYSNKEATLSFENNVQDVRVRADQHKLEQVLNNLIGNAIKYGSDDPLVRVDYHREDDFHVISVSDNGIGISEDDQKKLFAQFQRVGKEQSIPGTGLGLWLCNAIVHAHGGRMWVKSEPGAGSSFFFSLPV